VTRFGTNAFHGTLFEYFRNDALDANNWFANANNLPKPEQRQNDFGGVVGGAIIKDKMKNPRSSYVPVRRNFAVFCVFGVWKNQ
jgi:hypothetical protein